ncbi:extensin family protein [Halomonas sabkhae]|uniref:extensin-like domain-containing protein n=1 Tax=Halomonas sabkhae TaxID=626223 RepID=UPI0025B4B2AB|nr:extensin family protein [Halomonas sabkhae]MDN3523964.1 extensin family protein [Halomonas sabkhae]
MHRTRRLMLLLAVVAIGVAFEKGLWQLPREWSPFQLLHIDDPVTPVTRWKLQRLRNDREACHAVLERASSPSIQYTVLDDYTPVEGCPLEKVVRLQGTGVSFNRSFVATCPLVVAWGLFEHHSLQPAARDLLGEEVSHVEHYGSFACRNIYHRANARRSAHATASALDVAGFTLHSGRRISLLGDWQGSGAESDFLRRLNDEACRFFGTALGPDYNAAHANHFHLAMRGGGICR